jgi:hypothetical protein
MAADRVTSAFPAQTAYAQRLREASAVRRRSAGQPPGFLAMVNVLPGGAAGVEALEQHLAPLPA